MGSLKPEIFEGKFCIIKQVCFRMETHLLFYIRNFFNGFILRDETGSGKNPSCTKTGNWVLGWFGPVFWGFDLKKRGFEFLGVCNTVQLGG